MKVKGKSKPTTPDSSPPPAPIPINRGQESETTLEDLLGVDDSDNPESARIITPARLETIAPRSDSEASTGKPAFGTGVTPSRMEGIDDAKLLDKTVTKWPAVPSQNMTWDTFMAWYRTLTNYHHQHFIGYLYRQLPVINRPKGERYIDKFGGSLELGPDPNLTLAYITNTHGGGKYKLTINNSSLARSKRREDQASESNNEVCNVNFSIDWDIALPKVNVEELVVSNKDNRAYVDQLIREGKLDANTLKPIQPTPPGSETAAVVREVMDLLKNVVLPAQANNSGRGGGLDKEYLSTITSMQNKMVDLVQNQKGSKTEVETLAGLLPLIERLIPKPETGTSDKLFTSIVEDNRTLIRLLLEKSNTPPPAPPPPVDPFEQLSKMVDLQNKLRDQIPNPGPSSGGGSDDDDDEKPTKRKKGWDLFLEHLPQLMMPVIAIAGAWMAKSAGIDPNQQTNPLGMPASPGTALISAPANPQQPTQTNQTPTQPIPGVPMTTNPVEDKVLALLMGQGQMLINFIYEGKHGGQFAEMLVTMTGGIANGFSQIAALGETRLLELFKQVPTFWVHLMAKEDKVKQFITEFVGYPESLDEPGDEEEEGIVKE